MTDPTCRSSRLATSALCADFARGLALRYIKRGTMNKTGRAFLIVLILLALSSCWRFVPADGGFKVYSTIRSNEGDPLNTCSVELLNQNNKPFFGQVRATGAVLDTQFTVAPYKADYWLVISCPGYEAQRLLVRYGEDTSPSKPLKIEEIVMKKKK